MKLHFDSNQEYQLEAIKAVTDIFEGQSLSGGDFEFSLNATGALLSENGVGNRLTLSGEQIWENVKRGGILVRDAGIDYGTEGFEMPDMLAYIQSKTELTRHTILEILKKSGRLSEVLLNPQLFMDNAAATIKSVLCRLMVDGIKYEKIGDKVYEMTLFDDKGFEIYLDEFTHHVKKPEKTVYENYIPLDSSVENQFARDCENHENVKFYFKLPSWFKINTPIGTYNPD